MPLAPEWQHPFVNIFKLCDVDTMKEVETKGDVAEHMDKVIGKKVFQIRGIVPAGNYLRVPRTKLQSLGLTGRFLYIQLKVTPVKVFVVHIEVLTEDRNVHRVSISNMYSADALKRKSNGVQLPFTNPSHRWCIAAVDLRAALQGFTSSPFVSIKSIQLCSWLTVRTMFTSDYKFDLENLPSDMALSHALDTSIFEMVWLPREPQGAPTMDFMPPPKRIGVKRRMAAKPATDSSAEIKGASKVSTAALSAKLPAHSDDSAAGSEDEDSADDTSSHDNSAPPPPSPSRVPLSPSTAAAVAGRTTAANVSSATIAAAVTGAGALPQRHAQPSAHKQPLPRPTSSLVPGAAGPTLQRPPIASATYGVDTVLQGPPLRPDPALELMRMNAFSGEFVQSLVWIPGSDEIAFAAASVVVLMRVGEAAPPAPGTSGSAETQPGRQRHLLGHTAYVCALAASSNGQLLASAQEGKEAIVRLWDVGSRACLVILNAHASGLSCVDISPDMRAVAAVGLDAQGRQSIALWNIAELRGPQGKVELVTRHATEYNIKTLRFSAYQEDHLMTAGRDSIRIYRLKAGNLRGTSVRLVPKDKRVTSYAGGVSAALGPNIFTAIAFEAGVGVYGVDAFKVYVASASGAVFQVDYTTRSLDAIYQLHSAAINCLLVADGLAITGGDDRLLRAWPLDFRDYLLEAEHEGSVTGLALSPDALRVAIGTENGTLGCLHIPSHSHTTLLRSHCGAVNAVAVDPNRDQFCTVSTDGTLRIWHLHTHQQLYEFDAPGEAVTCIAYHPLPTHHELAAGFGNGRLRVFDIPTTTLLQEQQQHRAAVAELAFAPAGDRLFSGGMDGALVVYDVHRLYAPMQYLSAGVRDIKVCVAVSANGAYVASLIRDPYRGVTSILIFHGNSLEPYLRIETDAAAYVRLAFGANCKELWALTAGRRLDRYELTDGNLVQQVHEVSALDVTALAMDPLGRYVLTAGSDGLLRLWGCTALDKLQSRGLPPNQAFLGHPSAVLGAAFHRGYLVTVGEADCLCIWRVTADAQQERLFAAAGMRSPDAAPQPSVFSVGAASPVFPGGLSPSDLRSRATPSTSLGPVATPADHQLSVRSAALGSRMPLGGHPDFAPEPFAQHVRQLHSGVVTESGRMKNTGAALLTSLASFNIASPSQAAVAAPTSELTIVPRPPLTASAPSSSTPNRWQAPVSQGASGAHRAAAVSTPQPLVAQHHERQALSPTAQSPRPESSRLTPFDEAPQQPAEPPKCAWLLGYTPTGRGDMAWRAECGLFAYVVGDMAVIEHLATRQQRYLRGHTRPLACLAASPDGSRIATAPVSAEPHAMATTSSAVTGGSTTAPFADVIVWDAATGKECWRLRYHPKGVQGLSFSPDGRWLLSLGRGQERSVVVWDVSAGLLVAVGRTERPPVAAEWLWGGDNPVFASIGPEGLLLWTLQDSFLEQRSVPLSDEGLGLSCTALTVDPHGVLLVAEAPQAPATGGSEVSARIWHVEVQLEDEATGVSASMVQVANLPNSSAVTCMTAGLHHALVATDQGALMRFRRSTPSGTWAEESSVRLDGRICSLSAEPRMSDAVVATSSSTIWFVGMQEPSTVPIVCGQQASTLGLVPAPHNPKVVASTSSDGLLRIWHLGPEDAEPAVELQSASPCTAAAFFMRPQAEGAGDPSQIQSELPLQPMLLGGYQDGSLRLFAMEPSVELQWALARHPAPLVAVSAHPRRPLVLTASSDGSLAVTDLESTRLVSYVTAFTAAGPSPSSPPGTSRRSPRAAASPPPLPARPGTGPLQAVAVSGGNGASIAAAGWRDRFVVFPAPWDDPTCAAMAEYDCVPANSRHESTDLDLVLPPDVPALLAFVGGATKLLTYSTPLLLGSVLVYDYRLAAVVRRVKIPQMVRSLALSPDGAALVLGGMQQGVYVVHLTSGNAENLTGHSGGPVTAVAFSTDGKYAVSAASNVLMMWDTEAVLCRLEPPPPPPPPRTLWPV